MIYSYYLEEENNELYYNFSTPKAQYVVYFNPNEYTNRVEEYPFLLNNAYGFGFFQFPAPGVATPIPLDTKIKQTIEQIICDFYKDHPDGVLFYHCDYADGRQEKRSKKFERWYCDSLAKDEIEKHEIPLEILTKGGYVTHYIGYLCSNQNPDIDYVKKEFESFAVDFAENPK